MGSRAIMLMLLMWCPLVCLFLPSALAQATSFTSTVDGKEFTTFSFPKFDKSLVQLDLAANLTFSGNATVTQEGLQITPDSGNRPEIFLVNQVGRVFFTTPFVIWASNSTAAADGRHVASFSTVFKTNLFRSNLNKTVKGEGLAFVVASSNGEPPLRSHGGFLGLTNASTDGNPTNGFVAVELDTVKQPYDIDDNHVGLDINGVRSDAAAPLAPYGIQLAPSNTTTDDGICFVWVQYNGTSRRVAVYIAKNETKPSAAVLNESVDLSTILLGKTAYFGFSASTGAATYQLNRVRMWNMTVEMLHDGSAAATKNASPPGWKLGVAIAVACSAAVALGLFAVLYVRKRRKQNGDDPSSIFHNAIDFRKIPGLPKEFDYVELRRGTNNFDEKTKLGQGGYGVVYRATVVGDDGRSTDVAVKQFTGANTKGKEDFLAELRIIHCLRHRNLVKIVGWCRQNGRLLLVYDYMPNGSLDRHIFGGPEAAVLNWSQRFNVVAGVASALNYLHHEYDQMVIHRDIKPSNIMLDSAFNARLGDFGLARALESDKTSYTDMAGVTGTLGYIAPECFHTGRATRESDVYGFGAVILEIVCGRRISCSNLGGDGCSGLMEWVWKLHGAAGGDRILEAVDERLAGEFDEGEAERLLLLGLACSHPNPGERPRTRAILQILTGAAPPPDVPPSQPAFMWPLMPVALEDDGDYDGDETTTSRSGMLLTSSSSSSHYLKFQVCKDRDVAPV
ncbi:probable L-type lectin-domain containing receptor kinase S.5 [Oryza brachyantha]|uniref:probable L-type lectin-domain containing receptor kinase S.5 n=1 Tax=Oryza brachyantha TaxID=4533 RepID=UPI001ADCEB1B|nr:probable L-type lectin-domain containing receptor kinase S.5 [Oryza brachyantha]